MSSIHKDLQEGKETLKRNVMQRKESLQRNLSASKESLKQNVKGGRDDIMRNFNLLVNKVEAGVNKNVRKIASHIPNALSPENEKVLPELGFIQVGTISTRFLCFSTIYLVGKYNKPGCE